MSDKIDKYTYLLDYCTTDRQKQVLEAVIRSGGVGAASRELSISKPTISQMIKRAACAASVAGNAPGHWNDGVAVGYKMGKVTVQRGPEGVERVWERQHPDAKAMQAVVEVLQDRAENIPPIDVSALGKPEGVCNSDLLTSYFIADLHVGMLAWGKEGGDPWDLRISTEVLKNALANLARSSPDSELAILNFLGDFSHWDGVFAVTPTAKNILDSDIRFPKLQYAVLEIAEEAIKMLLKKHDRVRFVECEGNHDPASSSWVRIAMSRIFHNSKRVEVDLMPCPYNAYLHGQVMLGFHHGHRKKGKILPGIFASEPRFREMWGKAKYTYIHTAHNHSSELLLDEAGGAIVERHPTLAARDSFTTGLGAVSQRCAKAITYHKDTGEVHRVTVYPEFSEE